jgi:adenine-specific DNA-methyltransferase
VKNMLPDTLLPPAKNDSKQKFGQYFTPKYVAEFIVSLVQFIPESAVLEPACGQGVFLDVLEDKGHENIVAYEIDTSLANQYPCVRYESFVSATIEQKFDIVLGNPPYIRWANLEPHLKNELSNNRLWNTYCNSLCDYMSIFLLRSVEVLQENGQLVFICPEYWFTTTHGQALRDYMLEHGYFERIIHFNETPLFKNANVSLVIFVYRKAQQIRETVIQLTRYNSRSIPSPDTMQNLGIFRPGTNGDIENSTIAQFQIGERWILADTGIRGMMNHMERACSIRNHAHDDQILPASLFDNVPFDISQNVLPYISLSAGVKKHTRLKSVSYYTIGDVCDIGNGFVSGLDKAFQLDNELRDYLTITEQEAILTVVKAKNIYPFYAETITPYIFVPFSHNTLSDEEFAEHYPHFARHLQAHKSELNIRYSYNRTLRYWEWAFLRNLTLFNRPEPRIFVPCKERISHKQYFRFALAAERHYPTQDVTALLKKSETRESLLYIMAWLNSSYVFTWLRYNGIVKGSIVEFSEKPIASIPFRSIDWKNSEEVEIHDSIDMLVKRYMVQRDEETRKIIDNLIDMLVK